MLVGYAKSFTQDLDGQYQYQQLRQHGVGDDNIYIDGKLLTGSQKQLQKALNELKDKDTLVIGQLLCLGDSLDEINKVVKLVIEKKASIQCLREELIIDSANNVAELVGIFSKFQEEATRERNRLLVVKSKRQGNPVGKPPKLSESQREAIKKELLQGESAVYLARKFGVSTRTIHRIKSGS